MSHTTHSHHGHDTRMLRVNPVHQITPFTYRDGSTYLEVLNALRDYITCVAVPEVHRELNRIISEFQEALSEVERTRDADLNRWEALFEQFMEDVTQSLAGLNDEAVARNILDNTTATWDALGQRFPTHARVNALVDNLRSDLNNAVETINDTIENLDERLTGDLSDLDERLTGDLNTLENTLNTAVSALEAEDERLAGLISDVQDTAGEALSLALRGLTRRGQFGALDIESVDEMGRSDDHMGIWYGGSSTEIGGLPVTPAQGFVFFHYNSGSTYSLFQEYIDSARRYWRESNNVAADDPDYWWGPWRRIAEGGDVTELESRIDRVRDSLTSELNSRTAGMVRGAGVNRIIASKNIETPLNDGELLVAIDTPKYFTDFSDATVGEEKVPEGWTRRWGNSDEGYSVIEVDGRKVFAMRWASISRRLVSWDALNVPGRDQGDVEIVFKWRTENMPETVSVRGVTHATADMDTALGYQGGRQPAGRHILSLFRAENDPQAFTRGPEGNDPAAWEWWITRFRVEASGSTGRMMARSWRNGYPEPQWWAEVALNSTFAPGYIGIYPYTSGRQQLDWVGVAFEGGRAPIGD